MLVANRMTKEPVTAESVDLLIRASHKMQAGGFRRLPVVADGKLVGIITERDLREHRGHLEHTKINGVMSELDPGSTIEEQIKTALRALGRR